MIHFLLAFNAFQIETQGEVTVQLRDNMDILIPGNKVLQHIKAFWRNGAFFISMSYSGDPDLLDVDVITPRMFEDYMKQINQRELLTECKGQVEQNIVSRQKIVQIAVDYMITIFGDDVSMFQRKLIANVLIKLFPFMGFTNGQNIGLVCTSDLFVIYNRMRIVILLSLFFNHFQQTLMNGSNSGWLNVRYYYIRKMKRSQESSELLRANGAVASPIQMPDDNHDVQSDVHFLKSLIINVEHMDVIKQLLNRTREYRAQMLEKNETEIKEHFPYFFSHPLEMVGFHLFNF